METWCFHVRGALLTARAPSALPVCAQPSSTLDPGKQGSGLSSKSEKSYRVRPQNPPRQRRASVLHGGCRPPRRSADKAPIAEPGVLSPPTHPPPGGRVSFQEAAPPPAPSAGRGPPGQRPRSCLGQVGWAPEPQGHLSGWQAPCSLSPARCNGRTQATTRQGRRGQSALDQPSARRGWLCPPTPSEASAVPCPAGPSLTPSARTRRPRHAPLVTLTSLLNSREPCSHDSPAPRTPVVDLLTVGAHGVLTPHARDGRSGCCGEQTLPALAVPSPATRHLQPAGAAGPTLGTRNLGEGLRQTGLPSCGVNVPSWRPGVGVGGGPCPRAAQT